MVGCPLGSQKDLAHVVGIPARKPKAVIGELTPSCRTTFDPNVGNWDRPPIGLQLFAFCRHSRKAAVSLLALRANPDVCRPKQAGEFQLTALAIGRETETASGSEASKR